MDRRVFLAAVTAAATRRKPRRHIVTCQDTWAPGEKPAHKLPIDAESGRWFTVRQPVGDDASNGDARRWEVHCNGVRASFQRVESALKPGPDTTVFRFAAKLNSLEAAVDVKPDSAGRVEWLEILLEP